MSLTSSEQIDNEASFGKSDCDVTSSRHFLHQDKILKNLIIDNLLKLSTASSMDKGDFSVRFNPYGRTSVFNRLGVRKSETPINQQSRRVIGAGDNPVKIKIYQLPQYSSPYRYVRDGFAASGKTCVPLSQKTPTSPNSRGLYRYIKKTFEDGPRETPQTLPRISAGCTTASDSMIVKPRDKYRYLKQLVTDQKEGTETFENTHRKNGKLSGRVSVKVGNKGALGFESTIRMTRSVDVGFQPAPKREASHKQAPGSTEKIDLRTKLNRLRKDRGNAPNGQANLLARDFRIVKPKQRFPSDSHGTQYSLVNNTKATENHMADERNETIHMKTNSSNIVTVNAQITTNQSTETMKTYFPPNLHESDSLDLVNGTYHVTVPSAASGKDGNAEKSRYFDSDVKEFLEWITNWQLEVLEMKSEKLRQENIHHGVYDDKCSLHQNIPCDKVDVGPNKAIRSKTEVIKASAKRGKNGTDLLGNRVHWKAKCEMYYQEFRAAQKWRVIQDRRLRQRCLYIDPKRQVIREGANRPHRVRLAVEYTVEKQGLKRHAPSDNNIPDALLKRAS